MEKSKYIMNTSISIKTLFRQLRLFVVTLYAVQDCDNFDHPLVAYFRRIRANASREEAATNYA